MNEESQSRSRFNWLAWMLFICILLLFIPFRQVLQEKVGTPLLYMLWLGGLLFKSIHQAVFWFTLLLSIAFILLRSLHQASPSTIKEAQSDLYRADTGRISFWERHIHIYDQQGPRLNHASHEMRRLLLAVLAYKANIKPREMERQIRQGEVEAPPELRLYLERSTPTPSPIASKGWQGILRIKSSPAGQTDQEFEKALAYIEQQLEEKHDH